MGKRIRASAQTQDLGQQMMNLYLNAPEKLAEPLAQGETFGTRYRSMVNEMLELLKKASNGDLEWDPNQELQCQNINISGSYKTDLIVYSDNTMSKFQADEDDWHWPTRVIQSAQKQGAFVIERLGDLVATNENLKLAAAIFEKEFDSDVHQLDIMIAYHQALSIFIEYLEQ